MPARAFAKRGLMTPLMMASRSGYGANALFIALMVSHSKSSKPQPNASRSCSISWVIEVARISRLSVLTVTRKRSLRSRSIGCSWIDATAPVWTLEVGHISSAIRSRTTRASSSGSRATATPWPIRTAPS